MAKTTPTPLVPFIMAIFTNFLFVVGVVMMIMGFVNGTSTIAKMSLFEEYPLPSYEESRCNYPYYPSEPAIGTSGTDEATIMKQEQQQKEQQAKCEKDVERQRSVKKVEDVTFSISAFVAGLVLTLAFKQFIFQKK